MPLLMKQAYALKAKVSTLWLKLIAVSDNQVLKCSSNKEFFVCSLTLNIWPLLTLKNNVTYITPL
jgi:hypothetical protein